MSEAQLALDGGAPVRVSPFATSTPQPDGRPDPRSAVAAALSEWVGGRTPVLCGSREEAYALALRHALGSRDPADVEIAAPTIGGEAAARAALALGMRVLPIDVDADTANVSARALAASVGERTRALVVAHAFGHPATMPDLMRIADHYGLAVIEDVSASLGAAVGATPVGTFGAITILGGGPGHIVTSPEVAAVLPAAPTDVAALEAARDDLAATRAHPAAPAAADDSAWRLALAELANAPAELHGRRQAAWHLAYELRQVRGVSSMHHGRSIRHGYDQYVLRIRSVLWNRSLEETAAALAAEGIPAAVAVASMLHEDQDVIAPLGDDERAQPERFNVARQLATELLAIPLTGTLTSRDMDDVAHAIRKVAAASQRVDAPR